MYIYTRIVVLQGKQYIYHMGNTYRPTSNMRVKTKHCGPYMYMYDKSIFISHMVDLTTWNTWCIVATIMKLKQFIVFDLYSYGYLGERDKAK